jgi:hypothetical protein
VPHAPPISPSWFDHPNNIWWWVQIIKIHTHILFICHLRFLITGSDCIDWQSTSRSHGLSLCALHSSNSDKALLFPSECHCVHFIPLTPTSFRLSSCFTAHGFPQISR